MNTIIQKNAISAFARHIAVFVVAFGVAALLPALTRAQDYGYSYYEPSASGVDYGSSFYQPASASAADYGYSYYEPTVSARTDYGYSYYEPSVSATDYGYSYYEPNDYGYSYYEKYAGPSIDPNASSIDANASSIDMNASSIDPNASSIYSAGSTYDVYSVYSIPSYNYNYGTAALGFGLGYALGYGLTYPHYSYQNYPVVTAGPSNTSIYSPANTCTAPNTCNTAVDDHSVVNAPTYTQPATAYVAPVVQTVPYYTAQAYVPYTYTSPSYVYTNPAPYYAPVNPVVNPSPYVALTQIPYTGFDLGPFGNALYWLGLLGVAAAGAYLIVYYLPALLTRQAGLPRMFSSRGNAMAFAGMANGSKTVKSEVANFQGDTLPARNHLGTTSAIGDNPRSNLRTSVNQGTSDMMRIIKSAHGAAPRIVISRS